MPSRSFLTALVAMLASALLAQLAPAQESSPISEVEQISKITGKPIFAVAGSET